MRTLKGITMVLMLVTVWMAAVFSLFNFITVELDKSETTAHGIMLAIRTFWLVMPCMFIGNFVATIQKKFDL